MAIEVEVPRGKFQGHAKDRSGSLAHDDELTKVGPETPCGEYFRRFWHPIALTQQITDLPLRVRILGEDLVLFRDGRGRYGLLQLHCSHRNASLEFGHVEETGIRCCYHGWLYDVDGTVLETPAEPSHSRIRQSVVHGAYPVVEFHGLVFAYMGPLEEQPPFPLFDTYEIPGDEMVPYLIPVPVNWLQVSENTIDPYHVPFLHARVTGKQFQDNMEVIGRVNYHERSTGFFYTTARRVDDFMWVRVHDHLLPNFSQNGGMWTEGNQPLYFARAGLTRWCVPVDDTNCMVVAWRHFNTETDPNGRGRKDLCGYNSVDFYGQTGARTYEEMQRRPGDYEAWISQGRNAVHAREHLASSDKGVASLRRRLRRAIRTHQAGERPLQPTAEGNPILTYAGDTVLRVPQRNMDDVQLADLVSKCIAEIYRSGDRFAGEERRQFIKGDLRKLEEQGIELTDDQVSGA